LEDHICVCTKCLLNTNNPIFTAKGKKTEFILKNYGSLIVDKYIVDDCLLKAKTREEKCDYLLNVKTKKLTYLVECKGSDILKAVSQINSTFDILKHNFADYIIKRRIIATKVYTPDMRTQDYKNLREKLKGNLKTRSIGFTENI